MARPIWTGALTFGLVNVPVKLFSAVSQKEIHFHMVHAKDGGRIRQKRVCEEDGKEVPYSDIAKGYEASPGKRVVVSKEELAELTPESSKTIDITDFVEAVEIDPIYYEHAYHLAPDKSAGKSYGLLVAAMKKTGKVAIARMVMRTKGYLCAIRAVEHGLMLSTMLYADEVIDQKSVTGMPKSAPKANDKELAMAEKLIDSLSGKFEPERYHDEHREQVAALLKKKAAGKTIEIPEEEQEPVKVVNLMDALEQSLAAGGKSSSKQASRARDAARKRTRKSAASRSRSPRRTTKKKKQA